MTPKSHLKPTRRSPRDLYVVVTALIAMTMLSACRECRIHTPWDGPNCTWVPDGGPSPGISAKYYFTETQSPKVTPDFGCHFETDGDALFFVEDGQICSSPSQPDVSYDDPRFVSVSCVPPEGVWFMATGARTIKVTVTDAGVTCE